MADSRWLILFPTLTCTPLCSYEHTRMPGGADAGHAPGGAVRSGSDTVAEPRASRGGFAWQSIC